MELDERVAHDLSMRINQLDDRVDGIDRRVVELEVTRPMLVQMLEENKESNKELNKTMGQLQMFIGNVTDKLDRQSEKLDNVGKRVRELDDKIGEANKRIMAVDEKGKFDILGFIKANWVAIGAFLLLGISYVTKLI